MKKAVALALCALMMLFTVSLASGAIAQGDASRRISVITTIFPEHDWIRVIANGVDTIETSLLVKNGIDLHSFQPTVEDMVKISSCDLFIHVGGESDAWIEKALANASNKGMKVLNLLKVLGKSAKEEMLVEGMQSAGEEKGEACREEDVEYDEHVWLSLRNAAIFVNRIRDALVEIDPAHAATYKANAAAYLGALHDLDLRYADAVATSSRKVLLFGDRFPFRYLTDDYGLSYHAAFAGCTAESEASFRTVEFLAKKVDALGLPVVLTLEGGDQRIARTVVAATKNGQARILAMDSMQAVRDGDFQRGASYLAIMEKNLEVLKAALR